MLTVEIISKKRRRLTLFWRRRFSFAFPQSWAEVPARSRALWWSICVEKVDVCAAHLVTKIIPQRWRRGLSDEDRKALVAAMEWSKPKPDCASIPVPEQKYKGSTFAFPAANGENLACLEFALCDDLYGQYVSKQDSAALNLLTWALWREKEPDSKLRAARGDDRVLLSGIGEVREREKHYGTAPVEMQVQSLLYFAGLKQYLQAVYGAYIFEQPDDDDDTPPQPASTTPNFGWWGIFQAVAEAGIFGDNEKVFQTNLHEVCVYLVRKKVESDRTRSASSTPNLRYDDLP